MPTLDCAGKIVTRPASEIAHFMAYTGTAMGGPVHSMAAYVQLLAENGWRVTVCSSSKKSDGDSVQLDSRVKHIQALASEISPLRYSAALREQVDNAHIDLIHSHGLWTDAHRLAGQIARARKLPHLIAPCGMLAPGALRHHGLRKQAALVLFQRKILRDAQCLHAKSQKEYDDIRQFGLRNPVAVIPNPISAPSDPDAASQNQFRLAHNMKPATRILLFLGRLHPVKGLPRLIHAWSNVRDRRHDWTLVLAGPDEGGHRKELESLATRLNCRDQIVFTGELDNSKKWIALRAAELFVMPSDFENFGSSIIEAMSCATPVITTTGTPWKELPSLRAGWYVEPNVQALSHALDEALAMTPENLKMMGQNAAKIANKFRPSDISQNLIGVYTWLLNQDKQPSCVISS
ncbi:MAG TPA: glycosyltransferase [Verrucomicrobiae bacterium]|jgi:glycosyltransferase involved in cell wall biosynthesis